MRTKSLHGRRGGEAIGVGCVTGIGSRGREGRAWFTCSFQGYSEQSASLCSIALGENYILAASGIAIDDASKMSETNAGSSRLKVTIKNVNLFQGTESSHKVPEHYKVDVIYKGDDL
jgi:hypothetical protein